MRAFNRFASAYWRRAHGYDQMKFTHDFQSDLSTLLSELDSGRPFAFTKFADGERLLLDHVSHNLRKPFEEWDSGAETPFVSRLRSALTDCLSGYYIGISCPCCSDASGYRHDVPDYEFYRQAVTMPMDRVTFCNIFVNANYGAWEQRLIRQFNDSGAILISSSAISSEAFRIPKNAVNTNWGIDDLIQRICDIPDGPEPIFVAAGPSGCILIHEVWRSGPRNRTIVDVGSTLDPMIHGAWTRGYHDPNHPNRKKICQWA